MATDDIPVSQDQDVQPSMPAAPPPAFSKRKVVPNACEYCRRSKMRCVRETDGAPCERCKRAKKVCEARIKLPMTKTDALTSTSPTTSASLSLTNPYQVASTSTNLAVSLPSVPLIPMPFLNPGSTTVQPAHQPSTDKQWVTSSPKRLQESHSQMAYDVTQAPLDMLATLGSSTVYTHDSLAQELLQHRDTILRVSRASVNGRIAPIPPQAYFSADWEISAQFDHSDICDPIVQNILSEEDAKVLFVFFEEHLQSMILVLDSRLHTYDNVRSQSNLLFTVILASASKFLPGHASTASRLEQHVRELLGKVFLSGATSLAICQAISAYCPWLDAGLHSSLDQTNSYLTLAYQKIITLLRTRPSSADANMLEKRSFERLCLVLYSFERGTALVSGRPRNFMLKELPIQTSMSVWANHALASPTDRSLGALIAIRQDVPGILRTLHVSQSGPTSSTSKFRPSPTIVQAVLSAYHSSWRTDWLENLGPQQQAYLSIVGEHTILSILVVVLKDHIGEITEGDLMQQTLVAALQVCQAFMTADKECIRYIGNNTWLIVCFAGCLALKLLGSRRESGTPVDLSIYSLLSQMADRLQNLGNEPAHRFGRSGLYGMRLRSMLQCHMESRMPTSRAPTPGQNNAASAFAGASDDNFEHLASPSAHGTQFYSNTSALHAGPQPQPDFGYFETSDLDVLNMSKDEISALLCSDTWLTTANASSPAAFLDFWDFGNS